MIFQKKKIIGQKKLIIVWDALGVNSWPSFLNQKKDRKSWSMLDNNIDGSQNNTKY